MQDFKLPKPIPNLLVIIALTCAVLFGWLAGHIMRFTFPIYQLQQSPTPEFNPHIKNGYEFELQGIRRLAVLTESPVVKVFADMGTLNLDGILLEQCQTTIYYASLPAKCHNANGDLVPVGEAGSNIIHISPNK